MLTVQTKQGEYTFSVKEGKKPLAALAKAVDIGDRVRFLFKNNQPLKNLGKDKHYFGADRVGWVRSDYVNLVGKAGPKKGKKKEKLKSEEKLKGAKKKEK